MIEDIDTLPRFKKAKEYQSKYRNMTERKANASAKSKEMQPNAQADPQLHHICFCRNHTTTTFKV